MDLKKHELTESDLSQLKAFIARKGFGEPALVLEILDHFACKVEELHPQHPGWTLERLMEEAHRQSGVSGFYPLVKTYEEQLQRHYNQYFRKSLRQSFRNAEAIGLAILAPLLLYVFTQVLFPLLYPISQITSIRLAAWTVLIAFAGAELWHIRSFPKKRNYFIRMAQTTWSGTLFWPGLYYLYIPGTVSGHAPIALLLVATAVFVVLQQARYATLRRARLDYGEKIADFKMAGT